MSKTLKQHFIDLNTLEGYGDSVEDLYDSFEEIADVVYTGELDRHRWYTIFPVVRKVVIDGEDRFFSDESWDIDGETNSREDCGWECPDLDDIVEVYPREVTTIKYFKEKQ